MQRDGDHPTLTLALASVAGARMDGDRLGLLAKVIPMPRRGDADVLYPAFPVEPDPDLDPDPAA
ncbi:hypothetical protein ACIB24_08060 [Spongisporangium articulatum]|uniref:Uncharacterized protein n=1 Tax=Spongisporangium articulatum TaxID=3362603 RepID=A0ABW8AKZ0_9ACTN